MITRYSIVAAFLLVSLSLSVASAQTAARVTTITAFQGKAEAAATLHVLCNGAPYYGLSESRMLVTDNGIPVRDFTLCAPASPQTRKPFKAMMVLDVSGSMLGQGMDGLKAAAKSLVGFMDISTDSCGIIAFNGNARLLSSYTADTAVLRAAIDGLGATGATAIWDAAYAGLQASVMSALDTSSSQAIIVMSDGSDNCSNRTPAQVIQFAQSMNRRIYTIGLGMSSLSANLEPLSLSTGGTYFYAPTAQDLSAIFLQIAGFARRGFDEFTVCFTSPDAGASVHEVTVDLNVCDTVITGSAVRPCIPTPSAVAFSQNPPEAGFELHVSPNPSRGDFVNCMILTKDGAYGKASLKLFDAAGRCRIAIEGTVAVAGMNGIPVDVSGLPSGVYRLEVSLNGRVRGVNALITR